MPEVSAGATEQPSSSALISHSNPVTEAGFTMIPNVVMLRKDLSLGAKLVYGYMKHLAWKNNGAAVDPPREKIAEDIGISKSSAIGYFRELQNAPVALGQDDGQKLIEATRRGLGRTNTYIINDPEVPESGASRSAESELQAVGNRERPARPRSLAEPKKEELPPYTPPDPILLAWQAHAPPLIEHRQGYSDDPKVKRKIDAAVARYGAEDVSSAIAAYAEVLASDAHFFTYRWTLADFLTAKNLDRFVPEADPLENFRTDKKNGAQPLYDVDLSAYTRA